MSKVLENIPEDLREVIVKGKQPDWIIPMLAKLTHEEFSHKDWIFERKLDGVRCLVFRNGGKIRIMSRNRKDLTNTYPEIIEALKEQPEEKFIIDGEMVAFVGEQTSFEELQKRMHLTKTEDITGHKTQVFYYVFDLIHINDLDITKLPVVERKKMLQKHLKFKDPVRITEHREGKGLEFLKEACSRNWEGLIAKKANSKYVNGRSSSWLKFKCTKEQELVIGGFTEPTGGRIGFGALLLGYYEEGKLWYAGKVGTGFNNELLKKMHGHLKDLEIEKSKFSNSGEIKFKNVHWVKPKLVAQIAFTEWTAGNKLRHPSFKGIRKDKAAKDVGKES